MIVYLYAIIYTILALEIYDAMLLFTISISFKEYINVYIYPPCNGHPLRRIC